MPVRRYEKGGRLAELLGRLTAHEAAYAQACLANIGGILCGTCPPMSPSMVRLLSSSSLGPAGGRKSGAAAIDGRGMPMSSNSTSAGT